jgi:hypothetical protein
MVDLIPSQVSIGGLQTISSVQWRTLSNAAVQYWTSHDLYCPLVDFTPYLVPTGRPLTVQLSSIGHFTISSVQWWTSYHTSWPLVDPKRFRGLIVDSTQFQVDWWTHTLSLVQWWTLNNLWCPVVDLTQSQVSNGGPHTISPVHWWTLNHHDVHW